MWRVRLDTVAGRLGLEVRDSDLLLVHFYALDCHAYTLQQLDLPDAATWWLGLEDSDKGMLYLHGYGDRKLGQHKGIRAFDSTTGKEQWQQAALAFYGLSQQGLLAAEVGHMEGGLQLLDAAYGKRVQTGISQKQAADWAEAYHRQRHSGVLYPVLYREGEAYFEEVKVFLMQQLDCEPVSAIEYAETAEGFAISYYLEAGENELDNFLAVFDLKGFLYLNELLAGAINGVGSDTFFIFMRSLFFVQNKATLKAYSFIL